MHGVELGISQVWICLSVGYFKANSYVNFDAVDFKFSYLSARKGLDGW